ncbi:AAA family ATPase [Actinomyces sp. 594]|uniref:AAA family ATPase n=1 Tax=Actinomyces sp. 594 TaxID=2057793 RepID=UPI001C580DE3|nr:AAA family ATPase [Actinomyces sp. 594]MBW3068469.1 AAA family ATPase [Actinomyces sp. 594]
MRRLLLMRGAPGCGKTTWVRSHGLEDQVVSADQFRELVYPRAMTLDGATSLLGGADKMIWRMVFDAAEARMARGATVVVDSTNLSSKEQNQWRELALRHHYRVGLVDCQEGISDAELRRRNITRGPDRLDESALERMLQRAQGNAVVKGVERISPDDPAAVARFFSYADDVADVAAAPATGASEATATGTGLLSGEDVMLTARGVTVIGDVQSCSRALSRALADTPDGEVIVFAGDLFDRGPDALGVFEQVRALDPTRVVLVQGNHELRMLELIRRTGKPSARTGTSHEQIRTRYGDRDILDLLRRTVPLCTFRVHGCDTVCVVTHGGVTQAALERALAGRQSGCGLAHLVDNEFVYGTSQRALTYSGRSTYDHVDELLVLEGGQVLQLHGHRNGKHDSQPAPADAVAGVYNLENRVEEGGALRVARLRSGNGGALEVRVQEYRDYEDARDGERQPREQAPTPSAGAQVDVVARLEAHPDIRRREGPDGVVSYIFTRRAFYNGNWDELTSTARGLFVRDGKVVGRGFDKFFNVGERGTTLDDLTYPVTLTRKVNGFLGIMFALDGDLRVWSKAGDTGYGQAAAQAVERVVAGEARRRLINFLSDHDVSVALEVTLANDPHLVDESHRPGVTALAVIDNSFAFHRRDELMGELAGLGLASVEVLATAGSRVELDQVLHDDALASQDHPVEGVVLADARQYMVKVKYDQYRTRRRLRSALERVYAGTRARLPEEFAHVQAALGPDPQATIAAYVVRTPADGVGINMPGLLDHLGITNV